MSSSLLRRSVVGALGLALVATGCSGDPSPTEPADSGSADSSDVRVGDTPTIDPGPAASLNPGPEARSKARAMVAKLGLAELAGQVIVARYGGTGSPSELVSSLHLGGVIVFDDNVQSTDQIAAVNRDLRTSVDRPLMIGVDQEGGVVERVKRGATRFPAFMSAGAADRPALTRAAARGSARELAGLGFTTVFAPSADVTTGADDPTIGSRSAGSDPRLVATHVIAAADGISSAGVMPVLKHFPGHGSVPADSHEELPVQVRSRAALTNTDLVPFQDAVDIRVPAIMVGHIDVRAVDPGTPSSLSKKVITGLLRHQMGFDGLVITDALDMAAVQEEYGAAKAAVRSLQAGADVLLMPADVRAARDGIVAAVKSGELKRSRLEEAATRALAHLIHQAAQRSQPADAGSQAKSSQALSAAAVTVVAGPCSGNLVPEGIHVTGSPDRVTRLQSAARAAGVPLGRGKRVALVGFGADVPAGADIVVATDSPYVLGRSSAPVRIATYGDTPGAMKALVGVLTGKATAPGKLPVAVSGVARTGC